jgi:hypothetical protein
LSIHFWTTSPNAAHLPNSSVTAQVEISERVKQVLWPLHISTWQSKPHQQHQNPAECQYQNIKWLCNTILDCSGAPAYTWLLCLMYVCFLLNNTWCEAVDDILICMSTSSTNDISPLLCFHFWEPVYYKFDDSDRTLHRYQQICQTRHDL